MWQQDALLEFTSATVQIQEIVTPSLDVTKLMKLFSLDPFSIL